MSTAEPLGNLQELSYTHFHLVSLIIFVLAIIHTFMANRFTKLARWVEVQNEEKTFLAELLYFLGEIEIIFGIWVIPLLITIVFFYNWGTAVNYINHQQFDEPIFVVVIMALAATKPIVVFVEGLLKRVALRLGGTVRAWWLSILTLAPLFGSLITEPGAMTLSALLLGRQFYSYHPSRKLAYATIGLLFVNISVGGVLTNFAAPPVLIVSEIWDWSTLFMLTHFGWKAVIGIILSNVLYYFLFRKELHALEVHTKVEEAPNGKSVPAWITLIHILLIVWFVFTEHDMPIFIGSFLMFLGFYQATRKHQFSLNLKQPLLVGFFLGGLVIHGGLQGWWIVPLLQKVPYEWLISLGTVLTAFNDNAAVVYLAAQVPDLPIQMREAIMAGVLVGGGLTVIANGPNPAGQMLLRRYFHRGISPFYLFLGALLPTLIFFVIFYVTL